MNVLKNSEISDFYSDLTVMLWRHLLEIRENNCSEFLVQRLSQSALDTIYSAEGWDNECISELEKRFLNEPKVSLGSINITRGTPCLY